MLDAIQQHEDKHINVFAELETLHYPQMLEWQRNTNKINTHDNI